MTNETDLRECSAQIVLIEQLLGPETFDLDKLLVKFKTKEKLLMTFKPRDYITILKDLESGAIIHPGDWEPEEKKVETPEPIPEEPKIDKEKIALEKELQETKDKLAELEALKELEKEAEAEIIEEVAKEIEGE